MKLVLQPARVTRVIRDELLIARRGIEKSVYDIVAPLKTVHTDAEVQVLKDNLDIAQTGYNAVVKELRDSYHVDMDRIFDEHKEMKAVINEMSLTFWGNVLLYRAQKRMEQKRIDKEREKNAEALVQQSKGDGRQAPGDYAQEQGGVGDKKVPDSGAKK